MQGKKNVPAPISINGPGCAGRSRDQAGTFFPPWPGYPLLWVARQQSPTPFHQAMRIIAIYGLLSCMRHILFALPCLAKRHVLTPGILGTRKRWGTGSVNSCWATPYDREYGMTPTDSAEEPFFSTRFTPSEKRLSGELWRTSLGRVITWLPDNLDRDRNERRDLRMERQWLRAV